jgi:hypothetical protein
MRYRDMSIYGKATVVVFAVEVGFILGILLTGGR